MLQLWTLVLGPGYAIRRMPGGRCAGKNSLALKTGAYCLDEGSSPSWEGHQRWSTARSIDVRSWWVG